MVPPRVEHVDQIMNLMVIDGELKASVADAISRKLWTDEVKEQRQRQWAEAQAGHLYQSAAQKEQEAMDATQRDLGLSPIHQGAIHKSIEHDHENK